MQVLKLRHTRAHRALSKIHVALFAAVGGLLKGQQLWSKRIATLLLIAALAALILRCLGLSGIARRYDRLLQANTERRKRVLSTFFIGCRLWQRGLTLTRLELDAALGSIRLTILANSCSNV